MGQEIDQTDFDKGSRDRFHKHLREETKVLKRWFDEREFEYSDQHMLGLEVEAWLVDENQLPLPENDKFLSNADSKDLVHELSQFNFELNVEPRRFNANCFSNLAGELNKTWHHCRQVAGEMNSAPMLVGILPTIRDEMLQLQYMSKSNRYRALNDQLFQLRQGQPIRIDIKGEDHFRAEFSDIMLEAAATSIQVHLQVNQEEGARAHNASMIASAPIVAASANSPFLYGHNLWAESRIPAFEQAISVASFRDKKGHDVGRVSFGTGYVRHSLLEFFLENLNSYPVLLPIEFSGPTEEMNHLRLQNGTLWRWNRPLVGFTKGKPHLRLEQRVMPAGPTITDIIANMAFYLGLARHFMTLEKAPEESMTFTDCKNNFYSAAQYGLDAEVRWFGKTTNIQELILQDLIPKAKQALLVTGVEQQEVDYYFDEVLRPRILCGQNGTSWQRAFVDRYGRDFQNLSAAYLENQNNGRPIHTWQV